jgi:cytochrome P450
MGAVAPDLPGFLFGAAGQEDPYPAYADLRESAPVHALPFGNLHFVTRYDDVLTCTRDHGRFSSDVAAGMAPGGTRMIITTDPPDHTQLRRLVTKPFRPGAIAALEPRIRQICEECLDDLVAADERGEADLVNHVASPLPVTVIAEMLGISPERRREFRQWSDTALSGMGGMGAMAGGPPAGHSRGAVMDMGSFFRQIIAERRGDPGDDLISALLAGPEPLTEYELVMFCITLLVAGNETTTNLIGNAAAALFAHPQQAEKLWADPTLIPGSVEEFLRYDPPAQMVVRRATEDVTVADQVVPSGSIVLLGLAGANRDPRHFPDPDVFDVARNPRDHVAFGNGIHLCLGAPLARLETRVFFESLIGRTAGIQRRGPGRRKNNPLLRGFAELPVRLIRAA